MNTTFDLTQTESKFGNGYGTSALFVDKYTFDLFGKWLDEYEVKEQYGIFSVILHPVILSYSIKTHSQIDLLNFKNQFNARFFNKEELYQFLDTSNSVALISDLVSPVSYDVGSGSLLSIYLNCYDTKTQTYCLAWVAKKIAKGLNIQVESPNTVYFNLSLPRSIDSFKLITHLRQDLFVHFRR